MARRRLHGETQKRRQKRRTRALKLSGSIARVESVPRPMPHELSPVVEHEDLQFLETMRDLRVRRLPGVRGAPTREQAIGKARTALEAANDRAFHEAMGTLGVRRLDDARPVQRSVGSPGVPAPPTVPKPEPPPRPHAPPREPPAAETRIESTPEDTALMEAAFHTPLDDLAAKFEGAPPRPPARPVRRARRPGGEPDAELDLHGATEATALRRLQDFLLAARRQRLREVLVITGRGLNSGERGPVLRGAVTEWLETSGALHVREILPAPPRHGGAGALWLVLR
jgi:DNA-nicking Smr family endonuclease